MRATLQTDGGSRGNPGPAGAGIVLTDPDSTPLAELGIYLGRCTNNVAEYRGLLRGLEVAAEMGITDLTIRIDSELIVKQIRREYRVKSPDLKPLYEQAIEKLETFASWDIDHVRRSGNQRADELANMAMDQRKDVTVHEAFARTDAPEPSGEPEPAAGYLDASGPECPCGQTAGDDHALTPLLDAGWCPHALMALFAACRGGSTSTTCTRCEARIKWNRDPLSH
ncbi:ribonuclease HI family protein [Mucisphaera calidilacus]|uniref:14.7 kDa ribonuclease H-like protein n=1 Tax=Mucisphaera calidilacus TaxID=2527982 RepID=A0A518BY54_9BACT|nr:ribonuclease HI family protein [Mucisphaera calidilacus]QDU71888.1 14.7 kDa ribonuclease H-like protein [Mucisphaera calidilacus]